MEDSVTIPLFPSSGKMQKMQEFIGKSATIKVREFSFLGSNWLNDFMSYCFVYLIIYK